MPTAGPTNPPLNRASRPSCNWTRSTASRRSCFRTALRLVTVRSGRPEPDLEAASPALRQVAQSRAKAGVASTRVAGGRQRDDPRGCQLAGWQPVSSARRWYRWRPKTAGHSSVREWRHGDIDPIAAASARARRSRFRARLPANYATRSRADTSLACGSASSRSAAANSKRPAVVAGDRAFKLRSFLDDRGAGSITVQPL